MEILSTGQRACNSESDVGRWRDATAADRLLSMHGDDSGLSWEKAGDDEHCEIGESCEAHFVPVAGEYVDDITGLPLVPEMVHEGRLNELRGFDSRGVYEVRSREWARAKKIPILGTR